MNKIIGALWARTDKAGNKYLSGVLNGLAGDIKIAIFKNNYKDSDKKPDYNILRSDPDYVQAKNNIADIQLYEPTIAPPPDEIPF